MKIGIVSLGLIGGSILKALKGTGHTLYAVTRNEETLKAAKEFADFVSSDMKILKECNLVFAASPISKVNEILDRLEEYVNEDCIVLDCSSVKELVMMKRPYRFIGSHPMAGTENNGFESSFKELFDGAVWVLTPFEDTFKEDIKKAKEVIQLMGAKVLLADAKEHDRAAALISHLPLIISQALCYYVKDNELAKKLASSGFRDMTRLACSNIQMAMDMKKYNKKNIDFAIDRLNEAINYIKTNEDEKILIDIKNMRKNMYSIDGKNNLRQLYTNFT